MSFQQALSGLNAAGKNLDVIGNNVANSSTVGFKGGRAEFADVYASAILSSSDGTVGIGTEVTGVTQSFTQGNISTTDRPFDVAISGDGFFRMDDNGSIVYTRNGQFQRDPNGFLINSDGLHLTGYPADADGNILTSQPQPLTLTVDSIDARATQTASQGSILDSRKPPIVVGPAGELAFDPKDSNTYTHATSTTVYDSLGNDHTLSTYYVKRDAGTWAVYATLDGDPVAANTTPPPAAGAPLTTLTFDTNGKLADTTASKVNIDIPGTTLDTGAGNLAFTYDMTATTQTGQDFSNESQNQDGYTSGRLTSFVIGDDGIITANYSNHQTRAQGQILLASFNNDEGLAPIGNNNFIQTAASGQPRMGGPGSSDFGTVRSGALEDSNVDLTTELVNMITAQRAYQANSQTIKTEDQIMQTLISLR